MTYAEVEAALARLYGAADVQEGAFRARIRHFQKLGIPLGLSPGKGRRIDYGYEHVLQWALCLEFAELGVDPSQVANIIKASWTDTIFPTIKRGYNRENNGFLVFRPRFMSGNWAKADEIEIISTDEKRVGRVLADQATLDRRRAAIINLSALQRTLNHAGLSEEQ